MVNEVPRLISLPFIADQRGVLIPYEFDNLPFSPQRFFITSVQKKRTLRGEHGHYQCKQLLFSIKGELIVNVKTRSFESEFSLTPNGEALYLPNGFWSSQYFSLGDEILGCLASEPYDQNDYFYSPSE